MKSFVFFMLLLIAASAGAEKAYPSQDDCPAMPYINRNPGAEYADAVRLFQGIPSIAAAPGGRLRVMWCGGGAIEASLPQGRFRLSVFLMQTKPV
ncbi:MAG: hypothetical protein WC701_08930 [Kiritimatiellales bacterium]|jgi:hypothetical protein